MGRSGSFVANRAGRMPTRLSLLSNTIRNIGPFVKPAQLLMRATIAAHRAIWIDIVPAYRDAFLHALGR